MIILSAFVIILLVGICLVIRQKRQAEEENKLLRYKSQKEENDYNRLMIEHQILAAKNDDNNAMIKDLMSQKHEFEIKLKELQDSIDGSTLIEQWKKELDDVSQKLKEKRQDLAALEEKNVFIKKELYDAETIKEAREIELRAVEQNLQQIKAALVIANQFEKIGFGEEMPCLDFSEYWRKNNFEVVVKLLEDAIEVAPQLKSELRKIEWSLCYLPYKKNFIKDLSRSGIYVLELKKEYEDIALRELGLKRKNDDGLSGAAYVGQAVNIYERWTTHIKKMLGIEASGNEKLYRGNVSPHWWKWRVIEWCDKENLDEREKFWIEAFDSIEKGFNSKK
ncbi:MAG: hypothetical protein KIG63_00280 [Methanobrevibacter sp.]|nr:hypothetical protein [Methanobrevibacter sp.]